MAEKYADKAASGGSKRYSFSSSAKSNLEDDDDSSYDDSSDDDDDDEDEDDEEEDDEDEDEEEEEDDDDYDDDDEEKPFSYFDAAAAALKKSPGAGDRKEFDPDYDARPARNSTRVAPVAPPDDPPVEENGDSSGRSRDRDAEGAVDANFRERPSSPRPEAGRRDASETASSRPRRGETTRSGSERGSESSSGDAPRREANKDYYDVLEMALDLELSSGDEAVRKKKKKRRKSKAERGGRHSNHSEDERGERGDGDASHRRRSAVFQSLFPPPIMEKGPRKSVTPTFSRKDLIGRGGNGGGNSNGIVGGDESDADPNDDLPGRWNPASLVTAAQSMLPNGKTDRRGFYRGTKGRADPAYGKAPTPGKGERDGIPDDYNLRTIGKSRKKKKKHDRIQRMDSVVWGDESILTSCTADREVPDGEAESEDAGIEMVDDYSYSEVNEISQHYLMNEQLVENRMWRRDRRKLRIISCAVIIFFSICLGLFLSRDRYENKSPSLPPSSTQPNGDEFTRNEPPPRPLPPSPIDPIDGFDRSSLHTITADELQYIVNKITPDASVLNNPDTPQSKALQWAKNDMQIYNVEVASRVAQRYALATLYYSTNGTGWLTSANWGNGHECEWYGVGCETGENNIVSVTYLELNSNNLDGSIPNEIGYITSMEQIHLWGNNLVGSIPSTLSQLVNLHTLYLDKNRLDGEMGDTFNLLKNLKHLDLSDNKLRGHIPHGLGSLSNLLDLRLSNNLLTSTFPVSLISLSNLQTLLLDSNAISGSLPSLVGEMRSLVTLRIHENDLRGKLPSFPDAERLEEAHFDGNYFSGPMPQFGSTRLRELHLGRNALTGGIPDGIGNLVQLEVFSANSNKLNSTIPGSISNATGLQFLDLSHNKLGGSIPREFSNLLWLREIRLDHNRLRGSPDWFGSMKHLEIVHLNNNLLDGKLDLPLEMGDLDELTEFAIENNDLNGIIGEFMCDLLLDVLTTDCWGFPPRVDCPCCTECF